MEKPEEPKISQKPDMQNPEKEIRSSPLTVYKNYLNDPDTVNYLRINAEHRELREKINQRYGDLKKYKEHHSRSQYKTEERRLIKWEQEKQKRFRDKIGQPIESILEHNKKTKERYFGFDDAAVAATLDTFNKFCLERYGWAHSKEWDYGTTKYLSLMSVILKTYGHNLNGVTIVEIGPGSEGKMVLEFFQHLGARAVGIDNNPDRKAKGVVKYGEWSNLSKSIKPGSADVIFTHNMTPIAHVGTEFEFDNEEGFEKKCAEELHKCLKNDGVLIGHLIESDRGLQDPSYYGLDNYARVDLSNNKYQSGPHYKGTMHLFIRSE